MQTQIQANVAAKDRDSRAEVYLKFLNAADEFRNADDALIAKVKSPTFTGSLSADQDPLKTWNSARSAYRDALNSVYVYGTAAAWHSASRLAAVLPSTGDNVTVGHNNAEFEKDYAAFLNVLCRDANASLPSQCRR